MYMMDVDASPDALPELQEFLAPFQVRFRRPEGREALERYTTGRLTELPTRIATPWLRPSPPPASNTCRSS